ncbi:MAG: hypothetical protein JXA43_01350 [Candidatus Diapherotrites archaeon]|nr:hypothetical protein [Candidatus Diapherotrites archaeon]
MKVLLIDSVEIAVDFFPFVDETLTTAMANLQITTQTVSSDFDIPGFLAAEMENYDDIFVFLTPSSGTQNKFNTVMQKLIDLEIISKKRIFKIIRDVTNFSGTDIGKQELAKEVAQYCANLILNPEEIQAKKGTLEPAEERSSSSGGIMGMFG